MTQSGLRCSDSVVTTHKVVLVITAQNGENIEIAVVTLEGDLVNAAQSGQFSLLWYSHNCHNIERCGQHVARWWSWPLRHITVKASNGVVSALKRGCGT